MKRPGDQTFKQCMLYFCFVKNKIKYTFILQSCDFEY